MRWEEKCDFRWRLLVESELSFRIFALEGLDGGTYLSVDFLSSIVGFPEFLRFEFRLSSLEVLFCCLYLSLTVLLPLFLCEVFRFVSKGDITLTLVISKIKSE